MAIPKTMKALVKAEAREGIWLREVPVPSYGGNDLLIKVNKTAICGTDIHIYKWDEWAQRVIKTPLIQGHEFVGTVAAVGANVTRFKVGDRISAEGHIICGTCRSCRAGKEHLCVNTVGVGVHRDGCFAEYVVVPERNGVHIHPSIPSELVAFFDPFGNATHCCLSFDLVGEDVLITGAGPIGIIAVAICKHVGARHVVITDVNDYRLSLAKKMGATRAVNVAKEPLEKVMKELDMKGFDIGLEMSGNASAFESMLKNMYHGGRISLLGILPKTTQINWDDIIFKGLILKGIYGREMYETWYKMQTMVQSGLDISPVLTHRFKFDDFQKGFDAMLSGNSGKVVLEID